MFRNAAIVWIIGLVTLVPYASYYLLFEAARDDYALLISLILFWIFGYWGVMGPILSAIRLRQVFRSLETIQTTDELKVLLQNPDTRAAAIDVIARENRIPRFLARKIYRMLSKDEKGA